MKLPDSDLRKYFQTMATAIGKVVYDRVPDNATYPYVHLSDMRSDDDSTCSENQFIVEVLFDIVTRFEGDFGGRKDADAIGQLIVNYLSDKRGDIGDFYVTRARMLNANYIDEATDTGLIVRKLIRMEIYVEQI